MFRKIIGTIGTRALTAVLAFITWTLNAHYLGPEQVGTISLVILAAFAWAARSFRAGKPSPARS